MSPLSTRVKISFDPAITWVKPPAAISQVNMMITSTLDPFADGSIHTMAAIKKPEGIPRKNVSVGVSVARWRDISMISKGCLFAGFTILCFLFGGGVPIGFRVTHSAVLWPFRKACFTAIFRLTESWLQ
nr:hypothetical protein [Psychrobacter sp. LV10R520-6]